MSGLPIQGAEDWMARERQYAVGLTGKAQLIWAAEEKMFPGCRKDSERSLLQGLLPDILDGILLNAHLSPHTEYFSHFWCFTLASEGKMPG